MKQFSFQASSQAQVKEMTAYFNSLPAYIQESILQSGASFSSKEEMMQCVSALTELR